MTDASQAPATKQDIAMMMDEFGKLRDEIVEWKEEIVHEFHVVKEDIRHDALGANKDRIENHENRLKRVETELHLSPL
jgi:hypothetical protein